MCCSSRIAATPRRTKSWPHQQFECRLQSQRHDLCHAAPLSIGAKVAIAVDVNTLNLGGTAVEQGARRQRLDDGLYAGTNPHGLWLERTWLAGTGQTIAIVDAYDDPDILESVDAFDRRFGASAGGVTLYQQFGPAAAFLTVLNQNGQAAPLPAADPTGNWEAEECSTWNGPMPPPPGHTSSSSKPAVRRCPT